ncbi:putative monovalent cation/H+ antiporter subunit A [Ravibacter arvi]|uniref:Monovalent cation/H+ antiporter subunit A n=1 Tax=Ravibacter arvi TaxID=2051041 RepID=A0ABP8M2I7_9BACT
MILAVLSGFIAAFLLTFLGKIFKGRLAVLLGLLPLSVFNYFLYFFPDISAGKTFSFSYKWIPSLGINLDFHLDGLSMLFVMLITGIGSLVYFYAAAYLQGHKYLDRFYAYLSLFMGSMLGLVLADNILLIFIFWELTSISSFFLIGFNNDQAESRKSALTALAVTGCGGFFLLAAFVLMGSATGTYSIESMLSVATALKASPEYGLILTFLFLGAFTKSAQFPFHFWLPGAMKAPTPISAYLHSATMVKAGIYLLARFTPLLGQHFYWNTTLMAVGGFTMLYAAFHSILRKDMKSILAYSTISALGILVFLLGIGTQHALVAAATFILVHALYKAGLFLVTGIVDHETGTRDIDKLGGLRRWFPFVALAGFLAALSNAGLPLTFGFIGKDLIYETTLHLGDTEKYLLTGIAVLSNIFLLYAGFSVGIRPFVGPIPESLVKRPHHSTLSPLLWLPAVLLGVLGVVFGLAPFIPDNLLIRHAADAIFNGTTALPLKIWHGFNLTLLLSAATLMSGVGLFFAFRPRALSSATQYWMAKVSPQGISEGIGQSTRSFATSYTRLFQNGYLRSYILTITVFLVGLIGYRFFTTVDLRVNTSSFTEIRFFEFVVFAITVAAIITTVFTKSRLTAIVSVSIIGYSICLIFVYYGAPDLAMTQFTIDTLTVVLFVLVLYRLPHFLNMSNRKMKLRDGLVAISFGSLISLITLQALISPANKEISRFYADNAYLLAKGKNVVNVILVDFRGADTMVEIMVLTIAALGVYSLLKLNVKPTDKD